MSVTTKGAHNCPALDYQCSPSYNGPQDQANASQGRMLLCRPGRSAFRKGHLALLCLFPRSMPAADDTLNGTTTPSHLMGHLLQGQKGLSPIFCCRAQSSLIARTAKASTARSQRTIRTGHELTLEVSPKFKYLTSTKHTMMEAKMSSLTSTASGPSRCLYGAGRLGHPHQQSGYKEACSYVRVVQHTHRYESEPHVIQRVSRLMQYVSDSH